MAEEFAEVFKAALRVIDAYSEHTGFYPGNLADHRLVYAEAVTLGLDHRDDLEAVVEHMQRDA